MAKCKNKLMSVFEQEFIMTNREKEILKLITHNPLVQQNEIAEQLGISRSAVAGHIMNLTQKGFIQGKGYILGKQDYIVVIGSTNMDIAGSTLQALVNGDSNPGKIVSSPGGVGRNIAENISRLGKECYLLSVIGDDFAGRTLLSQIKKVGIQAEACHIVKGGSTSTYFSLHDNSGEMLVAINDMDILHHLTPELLQKNKNLLSHASLIIADCNLSEEALAWVFDNIHDTPIFVDPVSAFKAHKIKPFLNKIHTLKPNTIEAELLSGIKIQSAADYAKCAAWFHKEGVERLFLSLGANGVFFSDGQIQQHFPTLPTEIVNVSGAGDSMMSGLAFCFLENYSFEDTAKFAQACSAITVSSEHTNHPDLSISLIRQLTSLNH